MPDTLPDTLAEADRLAMLRDHKLLDTPAEPQFDRIVHEAAVAAGAPMAMISLVDDRREWFKAKLGVPEDENPIEHSICAHAMRADEVFVVNDISRDERFKDLPSAAGEDGIRFYAGAPLRMRNGARLGTLCVVDVVPRDALEEDERRALEMLARRTVAAFELRREMMAQGVNVPTESEAALLDEAATMLERAAAALDRADATAPLAHLEHVIAMVEAQRLAR